MNQNSSKSSDAVERLLIKYTPDLKRIFRYDAQEFYQKGASYIRDRLDELVSYAVRIRDRFICVTCGRTYPEVIIGWGHLITRNCFPTRWDEDNLHAQCNGCNKLHEEKPDIYRRIWESMHGGHAVYEALVTRAYNTRKMSMDEKVKLFLKWRITLRDELIVLGYFKA
jgi:hypothetical protein